MEGQPKIPKILVADDDPVSRRLLASTLARAGYDIVVVSNGTEAWQVLQGERAPELAILDWMMPGMDGVQVCMKVRNGPQTLSTYIILLTARDSRDDVVAGLEAGADDYVRKPFDREELHARVRVGIRVVELQRNLADRVRQLEEALTRVKQLQGLLPICSYCKKIRNDRNYWQQVEGYITEHSQAQFTHSICPECFEKVVRPQIENLKAEANQR
jgi:sigma-B regulation protein RsbU (phosphoserine phosphatase)